MGDMHGKSFLQRVRLLLFALAVFLFSCPVAQAGGHVVINEISTGQEGFVNNEFIELYNPTGAPVVLDGYKLTKKTSSGTESNLLSSTKFLGIVKPGGYFVIAHPSYAATIGADGAYSGSSYSIASHNTVILYDKAGNVVDRVGMGTASDVEKKAASNPAVGKSIGRTDGIDSDNNSDDFMAQDSTPGKENKKVSDPPKIFPNAVRINEVFPYPKESAHEEYVELYNYADSDISLENWTLHDASKSGKYVFPSGKSITSRGYLVVFKSDFTFALNNSGDESVSLFDPSGVLVDSVQYYGSKADASYGYDGAQWRWSTYLTPNAQNIFSDSPDGEIAFDDPAYVGVYANFSVSLSSDDLKVAWDFGDGHKSYKAVTRHKYEKTGTYKASVKISGKSEDVVKNFTVQVEDYPHPKVKIIKVNANPKGSDENETITVRNKSKKKVNLNGWSIATSLKKNMVNHPIREDVIIKKGKEKEITHEASKFTLNNQRGKIELRYPDGDVASTVKYRNEAGVEDGEVYVKVKGSWAWQKDVSSALHNASENSDTASVSYDVASMNTGGQGALLDVPNSDAQGMKPEEDQKFDISKLRNDKDAFITLLKFSSGASIQNIHAKNGMYFFTPEGKFAEHYAVTFFNGMLAQINAGVNAILN